MAITLLGAAALRGLLTGRGSVRVANRTAVEDGVVIVAAAVVRHRASGAPLPDATFALDLQADESIELDEVPPSLDGPDAIEVLLRLRIGEQGAVDAYATARRSTTDPAARFEVGIRRHDGEIGDGEDPVAGFAEFAVYGLPVD
jgi:hypothetical protein